MLRLVNSFFFIWRSWFGKYLSTIWNMVPACLKWLVWQECNTRIFEDKKRTLDHLKSLLFGTPFHWARIWGWTNCISISLSEFLVSISFSSDYIVFVFCSECSLLWTWYSIFFNKSLITYQKNENDSKGVFVWRWNKVDGKLWRENGNENFLECVWLGGEEEK